LNKELLSQLSGVVTIQLPPKWAFVMGEKVYY